MAVIELARLERGGPTAVDPRLALRMRASSADPAVRIVIGREGVDARSAQSGLVRLLTLRPFLMARSRWSGGGAPCQHPPAEQVGRRGDWLPGSATSPVAVVRACRGLGRLRLEWDEALAEP